MRTLHSEGINNCLAAGRIISVTDAMWDISRVIPACAVTGQAAGIAAALSDDISTLSIHDVQEKLIFERVKLHLSDVLMT